MSYLAEFKKFFRINLKITRKYLVFKSNLVTILFLKDKIQFLNFKKGFKKPFRLSSAKNL